MDHDYFDTYDYYNFGSSYDKIAGSRRRGHAKHKERRESLNALPSGTARKFIQTIQNSEERKKVERLRSESE